MLTFVYPYFNRSELFEQTLQSFLEQEGRDDIEYELLVIDDGSVEDPALPLVQRYADRLPLRCIRIDTPRWPHGRPFQTPAGANNPALANNVGIQQARGDKIVLTSPEVRHTKRTNLAQLTGWALPPRTVLYADVWDPDYHMWISGGPGQRALHFLALFWRVDLVAVGGMDEDYLLGWAWEDTEFTDRLRAAGCAVEFSGDAIVAHHLTHMRPEPFFGQQPASFQAAWFRNEARYNAQAGRSACAANVGRTWGSQEVITNTWPPQ